MSSEEKKFSLDELPDDGSSSVSPPPPRKKQVKDAVEPRVAAVKALPEDQRSGAMAQRWYFDRPERAVGWVLAIAVLLILELLQLYDYVLGSRVAAAQRSHGVSEVFFSTLDAFDVVLRHPILLVVLVPFVFKFRRPSDCYFELSFDGIHTIRSVALSKGEQRSRVRLKWNEITAVTAATVNHREVLQIHSPTGKVGELIFDLDPPKKMAIRQIAKELLHPSHPFRIFMEKERT